MEILILVHLQQIVTGFYSFYFAASCGWEGDTAGIDLSGAVYRHERFLNSTSITLNRIWLNKGDIIYYTCYGSNISTNWSATGSFNGYYALNCGLTEESLICGY